MQARFEIGEVSLTVSMGDICCEFLVAVVPSDVSLPQNLGEIEAGQAGEF